MTVLNIDIKRKYITDWGNISNIASFVYTADRYTKDIVRLRSYSLSYELNIRATIY
jgi:hypothetical protein